LWGNNISVKKKSEQTAIRTSFNKKKGDPTKPRSTIREKPGETSWWSVFKGTSAGKILYYSEDEVRGPILKF